MEKERKKGSGGKREGAGAPLKYGEELVAVLSWVPESKEKEFKTKCKEILKPWINPIKVKKSVTWEINPDKQE